MIRFRYDNESDAQQGNKTNAQDKVKNRLTEGLILAIIAFSFSMSAVRSGYQDKVDKHMKLVVVLLCRYANICTNTVTYMTHFHRKAYHLRLEGYTIIQCVCTNYSLPVR